MLRLRLASRAAVLLFGLAAFTAHVDERGASLSGEAHATVSVLMSMEELVHGSTLAVVGQPVQRFSRWEELGGGKRIVTYTRIILEESMIATAGSDEIWVRTLGGKVDNIGQHVAGEVEFTLGETSLVFLAKVETTFVVTGMAQGHFPLVEAADDRILSSSPDTGTLLKRKTGSSAREILVGATLAQARKRILEVAKTKAKK